ncbi:hypothetical protein [Roseicyclus persicicus]|uniref:Uncharacterized protein n=1 Tax=Roseicyclus persicicus TaxID=2650661 RepID=A0A7X6H0C2_9RHOB|nr:hypothetical protein [Roseibacterium persicicum]NKX44888.1 hypothetical protein [Roseibacterium persicicum]
MAIPFTPIAAAALRYGVVAALAYAAARRARPQRIHPEAEAAMELMPQGVTVGHAPGQMNATGRVTRRLRLGPQGPGMEIDLSALARLRVRRTA